jgi:hypothetical protein
MGVAEFSEIMAENAPNTETEQLTRLIELELIQKRATWKQAGERYRAFQMFGLFFLFLLIAACASRLLFRLLTR